MIRTKTIGITMPAMTPFERPPGSESVRFSVLVGDGSWVVVTWGDNPVVSVGVPVVEVPISVVEVREFNVIIKV